MQMDGFSASRHARQCCCRSAVLWIFVLNASSVLAAVTRQYNFLVQPLTVSKLCKTKSLIAVNNLFPGPVVYADEEDTVVVNVTNNCQYNITIHWHGIRQIRSGWADGPVYITQCPLQTGDTYQYKFKIQRQSGTLWWHAHDTWLRGTVHGAIVVFPKTGVPYPFHYPREEHIILIGEWWNANVEDVESQSLLTGGAPQLSDAYTINGHPGPLYNCSSQDVYVLKVFPNEHYLLRIVNVALNQELFFTVANHNLTVVEIDGDFTKPYTTSTIFLTPGQSTTALFITNQPTAKYYMGASPYSSAAGVPFPTTPTLAIVEYQGSSNSTPPVMPTFPATNDTGLVANFSASLRSLADTTHPEPVPQTVDRSLLFTIGLGTKPCGENRVCQGIAGTKLTASMNNISFVLPDIALLQAYYNNISGVFTRDFPDTPPIVFNYTGTPPNNTTPQRGTRLLVIPYNANVQMVFQDTSILGVENHPIHVHGYSFYIVGQGTGNFNSSQTSTFNLFDPPRRNTVGVPVGGWAAIRFKADNPGVWYIHCHLEVHTMWGLTMAFIVLNGARANETLPPPPPDLPRC
ncbi:laccase-4 [Selaginella moellendorffii]|uniref:laccase-4 n=1 Tax=Selaginella moellendorffii TaxID=88036 RepID=UPI000D1CC45D|nr:laccase-4 [Selaginella moellendorffii]|eukprot:XP_024521309.1 laccase-4 [Selaginella moellendorffii]